MTRRKKDLLREAPKSFHPIGIVRAAAGGHWRSIFRHFVPEFGDFLYQPGEYKCRKCKQKMTFIEAQGRVLCGCGSHRHFDVIAFHNQRYREMGVAAVINAVGERLERITNKPLLELARANQEKRKLQAVNSLQWAANVCEGRKLIDKRAPAQIIEMLSSWGWHKRIKTRLYWVELASKRYPADDDDYVQQPCVLIDVFNVQCRPIAVQILPVVAGKRSTSHAGVAHHLNLWGEPTRYIAEGLSTSMAAGALFECKVTPTIDAAHMARYSVKCKRVYADKDVNERGLKAAQAYCAKHKLSERVIMLPDLEIPEGAKGVDFRDQYSPPPPFSPPRGSVTKG